MHPLDIITIGLGTFGALMVYQIHMADPKNFGLWLVVDIVVSLLVVVNLINLTY